MSELVDFENEPVVMADEPKELHDSKADSIKEIAEDEKAESVDALSTVVATDISKDNAMIAASKESLDELMCIEQEMAELKKGEPVCITEKIFEIKENEEILKSNQDDNISDIVINDKQGTSLGRDDLIAMLKGEEVHDKPALNAVNVTEDVTIEGEGSFQVMEVVDDDGDGEELSENLVAKREPKNFTLPLPKPLPLPPAQTVSTSSTVKSNSMILTLEQERAIAMEQMADISSKRLSRNKVDTEAKEQKPTAEKPNMNLLQVLGADWSDDDVANGDKTTNKKAKIVKKETQILAKVGNETDSRLPLKVLEKPVITSVVLLNQPPNKKKIENGTDGKEKKDSQEPATVAAQPTGFKRTRIIKRKIIWDPDAPETAISYAQLARSTSRVTSPSTATTKQVAAKKEMPAKKGQVSILKQEPKTTETTVVLEVVGGTSAAQTVGATPKLPVLPKPSVAIEEIRRISSPVKRRSQTPVANGSSGNKKKKVSEVDRLMGDEGAFNMLNALESELKDTADTETAQESSAKHIMRSRATEKQATKREAATAVAKKETPHVTKAKRAPKSKASDTWDYVYQRQATEESMIMRRRSNSSYSSNASLRRLSLDGGPSTSKSTITKGSKGETKSQSKIANSKAKTATANAANNSAIPASATNKKSFEFAKPKNKAADQKVNRRNKGATAPSELTSDIDISLSPTRNLKNKEFFNTVTAHKIGKVWQLECNTKSAKFTVEMLNQLLEVLKKLENETECDVVVISITRANFCEGTDLSSLIVEDNETRQSAALEIATAVKLYLKALATFPKPLIAAVNGNVCGLGVTQLILFDMVIAGDKSTYETSYMKIGQVPEGYCIWDNDNKISNNLLKKLLWYGDKVSANEAQALGLVYKLMPTNEVMDEAITAAKKIASTNIMMYNSMKNISKERYMGTIDALLDKEFNIIVEQWSSTECYEKLKEFQDTGHY